MTSSRKPSHQSLLREFKNLTLFFPVGFSPLPQEEALTSVRPRAAASRGKAAAQ